MQRVLGSAFSLSMTVCNILNGEAILLSPRNCKFFLVGRKFGDQRDRYDQAVFW